MAIKSKDQLVNDLTKAGKNIQTVREVGAREKRTLASSEPNVLPASGTQFINNRFTGSKS